MASAEPLAWDRHGAKDFLGATIGGCYHLQVQETVLISLAKVIHSVEWAGMNFLSISLKQLISVKKDLWYEVEGSPT